MVPNMKTKTPWHHLEYQVMLHFFKHKTTQLFQIQRYFIIETAYTDSHESSKNDREGGDRERERQKERESVCVCVCVNL